MAGHARRASDRRGVYMISVAAELAGMHPQTLRIYEARGLVRPERSRGNTRLYSEQDVARLRRIQELTTQLGMNLAGVEKVFELEQEIERMGRRLERLEREAERNRRELERARLGARREVVLYEPTSRAVVPARTPTAFPPRASRT